jgi:N-acetyl-gamma-glutamyl-phosphate reductase
MEQSLVEWGASPASLIFAPHLLPTTRGLLSTMYLPIDSGMSFDEILDCYLESYVHEPFIQVLAEGELATLAHVNHTNMCAIGFTLAGDNLVITSAIDNLIKGAAGQALQNMNVMFGLEETLGLPGIR